MMEVMNMTKKDNCELCGERLHTKEADALYYCMKCTEKMHKDGKLFKE